MIKVKNLTKKYGGVTAINNLNLEITKGEIVGIFGENGAGKSTLFKCILNFVRYEGEITIDEQKVNRSNIEKIAFGTSEHSFFPQLNALDHAQFYEANFSRFNKQRFDMLMQFFGLPLNKAIKTFSFGQQNQFETVLALCQGAEYIILDEPFVGNDIFNREDFYRLLLGILNDDETIILATHLVGEVDNFVSRAVVMKHGEICADISTEELQEKGWTLTDLMKQCYNYSAERVVEAIEKID